MRRLSRKQQRIIVALFSSGTSMAVLAETWVIPVEKVEALVREALILAACPPREAPADQTD